MQAPNASEYSRSLIVDHVEDARLAVCQAIDYLEPDGSGYSMSQWHAHTLNTLLDIAASLTTLRQEVTHS